MTRPNAFDDGFDSGFGANSQANLIIAVRNSPNPKGFQDGDIIHAFNRRHIRAVHAEHICRGKGAFPLIPALHEKWLEHTSLYKFTRTGTDTAIRENLNTQVVENITKENANPDLRMDVSAYVKRRLSLGKKPMFGIPGLEVWYGGIRTANHAQLDKVWDEIELQTPEREENYINWPDDKDGNQYKHWLFITVDDFDEPEIDLLEESEYDETDPDNPILTKARSRTFDWKRIPEIVEADITNTNLQTDMRGVKRVKDSFVSVKI